MRKIIKFQNNLIQFYFTKNLVLLLLPITLLLLYLLYSDTRIVVAGGGNFNLQQTNRVPREYLSQTQPTITSEGYSLLKNDIKQLTDNIETLTSNSNNLAIKDFISIVISTIAGGLLGFATVIIVEKLKEPNLIFEAGSVDDDPVQKRRFIHIKIRNKDRNVSWIPITTNIASSAKCIVKIEDKQFIGRWTSKAEPLIYGTGSIPIAVDPNAILVTPREDICPSDDDNEAVQVSIGMKYENEDEFYGFNNESYLHQPQLKNSNYKFGLGEFHGEIIVITLGKKYFQKFIVSNNTTKKSDFKLEIRDNKL